MAKVDLESVPDPPGFGELSKADQIEYLQGLWDKISADPGEIPVAGQHLEIAEERSQAYRRNPGSAKEAFEVIDRLAKRGQ
jgi:hypothetical protein